MSTTILGNASDDGLDYSVNILVDKKSFNAFLTRKIKKLYGEIEDPDSEKDPYDLFEMNIDFTDFPIMAILRKTETELSLNTYIRDEQRLPSGSYLQDSKTWKANGGSIEFSGEDLRGKNQTVSTFMLAFLEMRQFLRATGKLKELKNLDRRETGVIINATGQADDAEAFVVIGKDRPDLPCRIMGFGEETLMRPYSDEHM